ncbi:sensor domain-containing diguanylate cyclase [Shewanella xiamenensis]|uniref:sensor domain-containing diguanylate cyclase n=1 Tax=Shewanella xiamenensis TaxID=332186 RepID=UPI001186EFB5|nr:diguanylate cyclase [Shewanella xiamenensis]TVL35990.1 hypothetical protein AYI95_00510 [Shewanella xiamenensis]
MSDLKRLQVIDDYGLKSKSEDSHLESLLSAVADLLEMPIVLVSVISDYEQFFQAKIGITIEKTKREDAFCQHVVEKEQPLVVEDTKVHPYFINNPLVTGEPFIRFYAGVPLCLHDIAVGAVCVIDRKPRHFNLQQIEVLQKISKHVSHYMSLSREHKHLQQEHSLLDNSPAVVIKWRQVRSLQLNYISANIESLFGIPVIPLREREVVFEDFVEPKDLSELTFLLTNHQKGVEHGEAYFRLRNPMGKSFWIKLISKAFFDTGGKLETVHALLTDHTASKYIEQKITDTNQQMRLLLEASNLGTWDWNILTDVSKVNQRWCEMIGLDYEMFDSSSQFWRQLVHPADKNRLQQELQEHLQGNTSVFNTSYRMRHSSGHWVWIETYGKVVERNHDGKPLRLAGTHRDITYKKEAELLDSKQRHLISFINRAQNIYLQDHDLPFACQKILPELIDIADSEFAFIGQVYIIDGHKKLYIHAITELAWNVQSDELVKKYKKRELYFESFDNLFGQVITSGKLVISNEPATHDAAKGTPKGHPRISSFMGLPIILKSNTVGMIGLANKSCGYTEADAEFLAPLCETLAGLYFAVEQEEARLKAEAQLKNLAMTDPLTGLPNRRAFVEYCAMCNGSDKGYVVAILDIDHFKNVNDTFGHGGGDEVLKITARMMRDNIRTDDFPARLGGEEFILLMENTGIDDANKLLENLRNLFELTQISYQDNYINVTVSIGARYIAANEEFSLESQLSDADKALYKAKEKGRNSLVWF